MNITPVNFNKTFTSNRAKNISGLSQNASVASSTFYQKAPFETLKAYSNISFKGESEKRQNETMQELLSVDINTGDKKVFVLAHDMPKLLPEITRHLTSKQKMELLKSTNKESNETLAHLLAYKNGEIYTDMTKKLTSDEQLELLRSTYSDTHYEFYNPSVDVSVAGALAHSGIAFLNTIKKYPSEVQIELLKLTDGVSNTAACSVASYHPNEYYKATKAFSEDQQFDLLSKVYRKGDKPAALALANTDPKTYVKIASKFSNKHQFELLQLSDSRNNVVSVLMDRDYGAYQNAIKTLTPEQRRIVVNSIDPDLFS